LKSENFTYDLWSSKSLPNQDASRSSLVSFFELSRGNTVTNLVS